MLIDACKAYNHIGRAESNDNAMGIAQYLRELIWQRLESKPAAGSAMAT